MSRPRSDQVRDGATLDTAFNGATDLRPARMHPSQQQSAGPVRTCIGCRRTAARSVLVRFVGTEVMGRWYAVPDPGACRDGRGAWLHRDRGCAEQAERRRAFARALRLPGPVDTTEVYRFLAELAHENESTARRPTNRKRVDE